MSATKAMPGLAAAQVAWGEIIGDVREGAVAMLRLVVTIAGCAALLLAAGMLASPNARTALSSMLPSQAAHAMAAAAPEAEAAAETAPPAPAPAAAPDPRQKHVVQYLSRRYRVAEEATRMLVSTAYDIGAQTKLDPLLILSVVAIESSLNPIAESSMGAQGLMQVMTRVHANRFEEHGGHLAALDPVANMKVGSAILGDLIARGGSVERGLQLYVGAGNLPDDGGYGAKVLAERTRLAMASTGRVDAAIAAGRAAPPPEPKPAATADATPPAGSAPESAPAEAPAAEPARPAANA